MISLTECVLLRTAAFLLTIAPCVRSTTAAEPLAHAHAHNDYWHQRPLLDALDQGFTSVEADVYLADGMLLVGHDRQELKPERDLESLYLKPLAERARRFGGTIYPNCDQFYLFVDIKTDAQPTSAALAALLNHYREFVAHTDHGQPHQGAIRVIVTGNRPPLANKRGEVSYFGLDGRLSDLGSPTPAAQMPVISDNWQNHFRWRGDGPMPQGEREKLQRMVNDAHSSKRILRFWATPEKEALWQELYAAKVDLIGTDELERLATFLRKQDERRP